MLGGGWIFLQLISDYSDPDPNTDCNTSPQQTWEINWLERSP